jgi:WD40 repeat protein
VPDVKFSPDGKSFAVASMDHKIYLYNGDTYRLKGTNTSAVLAHAQGVVSWTITTGHMVWCCSALYVLL